MESIIKNNNTNVNDVRSNFRLTEFNTKFENGASMNSSQILRNYTRLLNTDKVKKEYRRIKEFTHKRRAAKFKYIQRKNLIKNFLRMQRLNKKVLKISSSKENTK